MREVVIINAYRSPIGKRDGGLSTIRPDELLAQVLKGLIEKSKVDSGLVEDVIVGCVSQVGEQAADIARLSSLLAGFPIHVPGTTVDRQCGSSQQAIHFGAQAILAGDMDIVIAAGVESMTRVPMFSSLQGTQLSPNLTSQYEMVHQGESAERIAEKWQFTRNQLDEFAYNSHLKAVEAKKAGKFREEILPITLPDGTICREDEVPRPETTMEILSRLKPSFRENGIIHPGNSSAISDGAAAILLMSKEKAEELNIKAKYKIIARTVVGSDPTLMLTGPIAATKKALGKSRLSIEDIDIVEINEAFAPVVLAWQSEIGFPLDKVNPNGGAIALGHPLGASGARLLTTMIHEMERMDGRYGLLTMCEGHGMANATIIEKMN